jgi:hypothetical protein
VTRFLKGCPLAAFVLNAYQTSYLKFSKIIKKFPKVLIKAADI